MKNILYFEDKMEFINVQNIIGSVDYVKLKTFT